MDNLALDLNVAVNEVTSNSSQKPPSSPLRPNLKYMPHLMQSAPSPPPPRWSARVPEVRRMATSNDYYSSRGPAPIVQESRSPRSSRPRLASWTPEDDMRRKSPPRAPRPPPPSNSPLRPNVKYITLPRTPTPPRPPGAPRLSSCNLTLPENGTFREPGKDADGDAVMMDATMEVAHPPPAHRPCFSSPLKPNLKYCSSFSSPAAAAKQSSVARVNPIQRKTSDRRASPLPPVKQSTSMNRNQILPASQIQQPSHNGPSRGPAVKQEVVKRETSFSAPYHQQQQQPLMSYHHLPPQQQRFHDGPPFERGPDVKQELLVKREPPFSAPYGQQQLQLQQPPEPYHQSRPMQPHYGAPLRPNWNGNPYGPGPLKSPLKFIPINTPYGPRQDYGRLPPHMMPGNLASLERNVIEAERHRLRMEREQLQKQRRVNEEEMKKIEKEKARESITMTKKKDSGMVQMSKAELEALKAQWEAKGLQSALRIQIKDVVRRPEPMECEESDTIESMMKKGNGKMRIKPDPDNKVQKEEAAAKIAPNEMKKPAAPAETTLPDYEEEDDEVQILPTPKKKKLEVVTLSDDEDDAVKVKKEITVEKTKKDTVEDDLSKGGKKVKEEPKENKEKNQAQKKAEFDAGRVKQEKESAEKGENKTPADFDASKVKKEGEEKRKTDEKKEETLKVQKSAAVFEASKVKKENEEKKSSKPVEGAIVVKKEIKEEDGIRKDESEREREERLRKVKEEDERWRRERQKAREEKTKQKMRLEKMKSEEEKKDESPPLESPPVAPQETAEAQDNSPPLESLPTVSQEMTETQEESPHLESSPAVSQEPTEAQPSSSTDSVVDTQALAEALQKARRILGIKVTPSDVSTTAFVETGEKEGEEREEEKIKDQSDPLSFAELEEKMNAVEKQQKIMTDEMENRERERAHSAFVKWSREGRRKRTFWWMVNPEEEVRERFCGSEERHEWELKRMKMEEEEGGRDEETDEEENREE